MNKLDRYIYYTICEQTYVLFKNTRYLNYISFCIKLRAGLLLNQLNNSECKIIFDINLYLKLVYGLSEEASGEYIINFFLDERYLALEEVVRLVDFHFKNSFN